MRKLITLVIAVMGLTMGVHAQDAMMEKGV